MAFKDFREFAEPLRLPINGKTYDIPPISARLGLQLLGLEKGETDSPLASLSGMELWQAILGSAWDAMVEDDAPMSAIARAGLTALADYQQGRAVAEAVWEGGIDPERMAARVAALQESMPSQSTDEASETPTRASTSGTTSRRSTKRTAKAKAEPDASAGTTS